MVEAVRDGESLRAVGRRLGRGLGTVQRWVGRAGDAALDAVDWSDRPDRPHRTTRTDRAVERTILDLRHELRDESELGEYGASVIHRVLPERLEPGQRLPSIRTIGRVLEREGAALDRRRHATPVPPRGWYLPDVRDWRTELDSLDTIEGLVLADGTPITVLTGTSLHGGLVDAWPERSISVIRVVRALTERWTRDGRPGYAQFDNDARFAGSATSPDAIGPVIRTCLALGVTPVFAPPREVGFQASIEGFNGLWQAKVWNRYRHEPLDVLKERSRRYVASSRLQRGPRIDVAPVRRLLPMGELDLRVPPAGTLIYVRRTTDDGFARVLGRDYLVEHDWPHRLVRAEVEIDHGRIRFFGLRRRDPVDQPLLREVPYAPSPRWSR